MNLDNAKLLYVISCFLLCLVILSPTLFSFVSLPEGETFSELWLLDPNHMIESGAVNVLLNQPYTFHLGVSNHMNGVEYYSLFVKLRNQSQAFQEMGNELPSSAKSVFAYRFFLNRNETWENNFVFSFQEVSFEENISQVSLLSIGSYDVNLDEQLLRDETDDCFYCQLLFELWLYNSTTSDFQFHNRAVGYWIRLSEQL